MDTLRLPGTPIDSSFFKGTTILHLLFWLLAGWLLCLPALAQQPPTPTIQMQGTSTFCVGSSNTFFVQGATPAPGATWQVYGVSNTYYEIIPQADNKSLQLKWKQSYPGGIQISVYATNTSGFSGSVTGNYSGISAGQPVSVSISYPRPVLCEGESMTFTANPNPLTQGPATYYYWYVNDVQQQASASRTFTPTSLPTGTPKITCTIRPDLGTYPCAPTSSSADVTVTVIKKATLSSTTSASVCSNSPFTYTPTSATADVYTWSARVSQGTVSGLVTSGSGTINQTLVNPNASPAVVIFTITPKVTVPGQSPCEGIPTEVVVTIKPTPLLSSPLTTTVCSDQGFSYAPTSATANTTFSWTASQTVGSVSGLPASGTGSITNHVLTNNGAFPARVTYTFTNTSNGCTGISQLVVTVNPKTQVTSPLTLSVCSGATFSYQPTSWTPNTTFEWSASGASSVTGFSTSGSGNIVNNLVLSGTTPATVTYVITPKIGSCAGVPSSLIVTVNPLAPVTSALTKSVCSGESVNYTPTSSLTGATFRWTATVSEGSANGYTANGAGIIYDAITNTGTTNAKVTYSISAYIGDCPGPVSNLVVTIQPKPTLKVESKLTGTGFTTQLTASGTGTNYSWSPATGLNTTSGATVLANPLTATDYTVTATMPGGCPNSFLIRVTPDLNYVRTLTLQVDKKGDETPVTVNDLSSLTAVQMSEATTYLDGLGRPVQSVSKQGSPSLKDMVQPTAYDAFGRETFKYLPYTFGTDGGPKLDALDKGGSKAGGPQLAFYQSPRITADNDVRASDPNPYAQSRLEASPLNRVLEQGASGSSWQINDIASPITNKTIKFHQRTNRLTGTGTSPADLVLRFRYEFNADPSLFGTVSSLGYYGNGELMVTHTADERNFQVVEYKDKEGRVVLKRIQFKGTAVGLTSTPADADCLFTYYIYDDMGQLRTVIQPEGVASNPPVTLDDAFIGKYCFTYHYDADGRMIEKRVPGAGPVYMVYNGRNELILSQDAVQRTSNKWSYTKYDELGRTVITGIYTATGTRQAMQQAVTNYETRGDNDPTNDRPPFETHTSTLASQHYYTNVAFPASDQQFDLTVNYYDDYDLNNDGVSDYNLAIPSNAGTGVKIPYTITYLPGEAPSDRVLGKPVASKVNQEGTTGFLLKVTFYDVKGRVVQTQEDNHKGGQQITFSKYSFANRLERSELRHNVKTPTASSVNVYKRLEYDHAGRLLKVFQQHGTDNLEKVVQIAYNELGQVKQKKIGNQLSNANFLQTIDYRYNIRGWMTHINDAALSTATGTGADNDLFGMELSYEQSLTGVTPQYNGNIASQKWKTRVDESPVTRQYAYLYDPANRITGATFSRSGQSVPEDFTMGLVTYDRNGNIKGLQQNGLKSYSKNLNPTATTGSLTATYGLVDDLTYSYDGNRLTRVDDAVTTPTLAGDFQEKVKQANEYKYDANGNVVSDDNKGIYSIKYNHLNLPTQIWFDADGIKKIKFTYTASGIKLKKEVFENENDPLNPTSWTDYTGGFVYEKNVLQFFPTEEGRALNTYFASNPVGTPYTYEYHYKDHLGNLRLSFRDPKPTAYFRATMELNDAVIEDVQFANLSTTRVSSGKTYVGSSASALKSASSNDKTLGPFKTLKVKAGDKIVAQVYANYALPTSGTFTNGVSLATYVGNANNVTGGSESGKNIPLLQLGVSIQPVPNRTSNTLPKAYLRYEYFDESYNYLRSETKPVTIAAQGDTWELLKLELGTGNAGVAPLDKDGYVQIYVANESNEEVRFDNLEIAYTEAMVVQENHYNPWGMNLAGIEKQGQPDHKFQYISREKQSEFNLNWIDLQARNYDPQLGRFQSVDPKPDVESQESQTTYQYSLNNPLRYSDPDGECPRCPPGGGNPMHYVAKGFGQMFQAAGAAIDRTNAKVQAFFSYGGEKEGKSGNLKGNISNETRTTLTLSTTAKDFFTKKSNENAPVASFPLKFSIKTTNETKVTVSGKMVVEGVDVHTKNVTSMDNSTGAVNNTTTITVGKDQTGAFVESGTKGIAAGVRTEQKYTVPTGYFIKWGGSVSVGTKENSRAND